MTFGDAVRAVLAQYATFGGRARRSEYWWWSLFSTLVQLAFSLVAIVVLVATSDDDGGTAVGWIGWILYGIVALGLVVPSLAVLVRRLHDTGRSAWWLLIGLVPIVGGVVILVFSLQDSSPGPNAYGPNPKGTDRPVASADGTGRNPIIVGLGAALIVAAIGSVAAAIAGGAALFTTDIPEESIHTVDAPGAIEVEADTYTLWYEFDGDRPTVEGVEDDYRRIALDVVGPSGREIDVRDLDPGDNFRSFVTLGTIDVEVAGTLVLAAEVDTVVYLTEPLSSSEPFSSFARWAGLALLFGGVGVVLIVVGRRRVSG